MEPVHEKTTFVGQYYAVEHEDQLFTMVPPTGCFSPLTNKLSVLLYQASTTANKLLTSKAVQLARYLATTDLKSIKDDAVKNDRVEFLMKHLPELAQYAKVYFQEDYWVIEMWKVKLTHRILNGKVLPLPGYIGGCPVYHWQAPVITTRSFTSVILPYERPYFGPGVEGGHYHMTPAEFLADETDLCALVQAAFPTSIGLRLHPWHYIDILYSSKNALNEEVNELLRTYNFPDQVCYMMFDLKVWDDKVKLPGTTLVRFDPEKRMGHWEWVVRTIQYYRDMDKKAEKDRQRDWPL